MCERGERTLFGEPTVRRKKSLRLAKMNEKKIISVIFKVKCVYVCGFQYQHNGMEKFIHTHTLHMPERIRTKTRMVWAIKIVFCFIAHMLLSIYGLAWCYLNKLFGSAHLSAKYSLLFFAIVFLFTNLARPFSFTRWPVAYLDAYLRVNKRFWEAHKFIGMCSLLFCNVYEYNAFRCGQV